MGKMNEINLTLKESLRKLTILLIHIIAIAILEISLLMNMKYSKSIELQKNYIEQIKRDNIELEQVIYEYESER